MKYSINITKITSVDQIESYWSTEDYIALLKEFDFGEADNSDRTELRDLLFMAITDFEPSEAAQILLTYKLSEHLSTGQIDQISHEMLNDKLAEEYPDISLHAGLFHINQLLYKAYNGRFPSVKASIIELEIASDNNQLDLNHELLLKLLTPALSDHSLLKRLFRDQLDGKIAFPEGQNIIWELHDLGEGCYKMITSDYWLNDEDFVELQFASELKIVAEEDED